MSTIQQCMAKKEEEKEEEEKAKRRRCQAHRRSAKMLITRPRRPWQGVFGPKGNRQVGWYQQGG
eukprot:755184-Hanusia_phi.AAC.2